MAAVLATADAGFEDDEWDYEYSATETDDLFFTLDLTALDPAALEPKDSHESQAHDASVPQGGDVQTVDGTADDLLANKCPTAAPGSTLQILDLHTTIPLVKFEDGMYSCYWRTDLGTQFYVAQAGHFAKPRRNGHVLDIIGLSQVRLLGRPSTLTIKNAQAEGEREDDVEMQDEIEAVTTVRASEDGRPLVIPREDCKDAYAQKQASFLERLSQIKLKRGERDPVPIYSVKMYKEPAHKAELKRQALEADAEKKKSTSEADSRLGKRRKRLTAAEKGEHCSGNDNASNAGRKDRNSIVARVGYQDDAAVPSPGPSRPKRARTSTAKAVDAAQQVGLELDGGTLQVTGSQTGIDSDYEQPMGYEIVK